MWLDPYCFSHDWPWKAVGPPAPVPEGDHWRDLSFLLLFLLNLSGLVTIAFCYGLPFLGVAEGKLSDYQYGFHTASPEAARNLLWLCLGIMGMADVLALVWMHVMLMYAGGLLQLILWTTVVISGCLAMASLVWADLSCFTFTLIAIVGLYFLFCERRRVALSSVNLRLACAAVRSQQSPLLITTYILFVVQILHTGLWCMAAVGTFGKITSKSGHGHPGLNTLMVVFLVLSLYW